MVGGWGAAGVWTGSGVRKCERRARGWWRGVTYLVPVVHGKVLFPPLPYVRCLLRRSRG